MLIQKIKKNLPLLLILILATSLRLYKVASLPAINPDEAAIGYNAYSLIKTGKDEHGVAWPLHFKSFGDYKPGGYFYLVLPFVASLGLNTLAVRLPNIILSILSIYYLYKLILLLTKNKTLSLLTIFILSVSPWHIHFSRGAWESCTALSFLVLGVYNFYKSISKPNIISKNIYLFVIFFSLSLYTYHSTRLIAPLLALFLFIQNKKILFSPKNFKKIIYLCLFGIIISTPVFISFLKNGGTTRFGGVGLMADQGPLWRANELINQHGNTHLINRIIHNKRILYSLSWLEKYLSHFDPNFLFIKGDEVPRSNLPFLGQLYLIELPFLLIGFITLFKSTNHKLKQLIFAWLLIAPIASSLTFQAPSALRSLTLVVPLTFTVAYGLKQTMPYFSKNRIIQKTAICLLTLIYIYNIVFFLNSYINLYPNLSPTAWQYGFDKIIPFVNDNKDKYDNIYFTDSYDQPYILYLFYSKYPPQLIQPQIELSPPDQFGFSTVRQIDNIHFQTISLDNLPPNSLVIAGKENINATPNQSINFPNGRPAFKIYIR